MADNPLVPALVVIAVAVSVQTVLLLVGIIAGAMAWRRWQERFENRYALIVARLDDTLHQTREAAVALRRVSDQAAQSLGEVRQTVRTAAAAATAPKNLLVAGMTAAGALLARWRRNRREHEGDSNR